MLCARALCAPVACRVLVSSVVYERLRWRSPPFFLQPAKFGNCRLHKAGTLARGRGVQRVVPIHLAPAECLVRPRLRFMYSQLLDQWSGKSQLLDQWVEHVAFAPPQGLRLLEAEERSLGIASYPGEGNDEDDQVA